MRRLVILLVFCISLISADQARAAAGHYVSGVEGIRAATLPPPGMYWKVYNVFYNASDMRNNNRNKAPGNFDVSVYALANRLIYSSEIEVLGGNLLFDVIFPLTYTDVSMRAGGSTVFSDNKFGIGDVFVEPFLIAWHGERYDALAALGAYVPTGEFDSNRPASAGMGFWTFMFTLGGTYYLDEAKTWSISSVARYEIHTRQEETHITPGNHFHFEWGLGKNFAQVFDIGVSGYCHWQVTDDSGPMSTSNREQAFAIGPEIGFFIEPLKLHVALRSQWEFENRNKSQGNVTALNFTYSF